MSSTTATIETTKTKKNIKANPKKIESVVENVKEVTKEVEVDVVEVDNGEEVNNDQPEETSADVTKEAGGVKKPRAKAVPYVQEFSNEEILSRMETISGLFSQTLLKDLKVAQFNNEESVRYNTAITEILTNNGKFNELNLTKNAKAMKEVNKIMSKLDKKKKDPSEKKPSKTLNEKHEVEPYFIEFVKLLPQDRVVETVGETIDYDETVFLSINDVNRLIVFFVKYNMDVLETPDIFVYHEKNGKEVPDKRQFNVVGDLKTLFDEIGQHKNIADIPTSLGYLGINKYVRCCLKMPAKQK